MSEVIVRMEMPLNCWECKLRKPMGICPITVRYVLDDAGRDHRPDWCPIIGELPEQHGDLIDRWYALASACSGLTRTIQTTEGAEKWIRVREVRESIKSAPIIVPATERSET